MEEKIYDRQVTKQSLAARVIDEQQIERHFSMNELTELYEYKDEPMSRRPIPKVPKDVLLAELIKKHPSLIWKYHDHDSLLENQIDENLTEDERRLAWQEFEQEKKGLIPLVLNKQNKSNAASQPLANSSKAAKGSSVLVGGSGLGNIAMPANINPVSHTLKIIIYFNLTSFLSLRILYLSLVALYFISFPGRDSRGVQAAVPAPDRGAGDPSHQVLHHVPAPPKSLRRTRWSTAAPATSGRQPSGASGAQAEN